MLRNAIRASREARSDLVYFEVVFLTQPEKIEVVKLKSVCGPGDQGEPVSTSMLPEENRTLVHSLLLAADPLAWIFIPT